MAMLGRFYRTLGAIFLAAAMVALAQQAPAQQRVGVSTAVNPDAQSTRPGGQTRRLVLGQDVVHNEHIVTDAGGQTQLLFVDGSAMAIGPNSDLTIDEFVYDPNSGKGQLAMSAARGVLRFVGGELSKSENAVSLRTPSATIGIRGGIFLAELGANGVLDVTFVYGRELFVTSAGVTRNLLRPGFAIHVAGIGAPPSPPTRASDGAIGNTQARLTGRAGASGGSSNPPTDASVANSGLGQTISGNVVASIQAEQQHTGTSQPTTTSTTAQQQGQLNLNTVSSQSQPVITDAQQSPPAQGSPIGGQANNNPPPTNPPPTNPPPTNPPPTNNPPPPVVISLAGAVVSTNGAGTSQGFLNATTTPYTDGQITYPAGMTLQNGVWTGAKGVATGMLSPLTPGATTQVTGSTNLGQTVAGTATTTADSTFFYANLQPTGGTGSTGQRIFLFGGTPVSQSFYAPNPTTQVTAFSVQPDAALTSSGGKAQTIPFLPSFAGGTMPNATVSPLFVVTPANTQFGAFNPRTNPNALSPSWLQASLAINGQGAGQSSALAVSVGTFQTNNAGQVVANGQVRGTVVNSATKPVQSVSGTVTTLADGFGNNLFGGNSISGFVLNQNSQANGTSTPNNAQVSTFMPTSGGGSVTATTPYAFNQPVTATALPANVGTNRSSMTEAGFFGGIMQSSAAPNFVVSGVADVRTFANTGKVSATFVGQDPFTPQQSGVNTMNLNFGGSSANDNRSAFIDNNIYAAVENQNVPAVVVTQTDGGNVTTGFSNAPLALVTSAAVPNSVLLPPGVSFCQCQFLQWGYWSASLGNGSPSNPSITYASQINTWVAGQPTVTMPTMGTASYSGAAVGTVSNNGANYLAAGGFNQTYNFGAMSGTVTISNFDNKTFSGSVTGVSGTPIYSGTLSGSGVQGVTNGSFFGPNAIETGGNFSVQAIGGAPYLASGIFAGRQH